MEKFKAFLDKLSSLGKGEPVLVIGNGSAVVIYLVANLVGAIPDVTFEQALASAGAGIVTFNAILLTIRQYVSPVVDIRAYTPESGK